MGSNVRKPNDFATAFWRKMSESLPPAVREDYLEELKSAEGFDLALDQAARAWRSLAVLLQYSSRRSVH